VERQRGNKILGTGPVVKETCGAWFSTLPPHPTYRLKRSFTRAYSLYREHLSMLRLIILHKATGHRVANRSVGAEWQNGNYCLMADGYQDVPERALPVANNARLLL
jgi:hypothetical protein